MRVRLRLLPVTVFAAALLLTLRLGEIWRGAETIFDGAEVASVQAQEASGASLADIAPAAGQPQAAEGKDGGDGAGAEGDAGGDGAPPEADDIYSAAEVKLLQNLSDRREELDRRAGALDTREGLLKAAEKRIDEKLKELKVIQVDLKGLLKKYDGQEEASMRSLVKIYENMKPKSAAPIFEKLEMDTLLDVVSRMREAKVAPILARMNPAKARAVTQELAQRRKLSTIARQGGS